MNDSIEAIVDDCSLPPAVYMQRFHEDMDESEMVERMCRDLIGRTIAQMGRDGNIGKAYNRRTGTWFHHGDRVCYVNRFEPFFQGVKKVGTVIGTAIACEDVKCLVVELDDGSYGLIAVDYAWKADALTLDDVIAALDSDLPYEKKMEVVSAYMEGR